MSLDAKNNTSTKLEVLMDIKDISLSFGGLKALQNVNLKIKKTEILAIIGPNGAGKSSMLNVISGIYIPQKGEVEWKGKLRKKIAPHDIARMGIARTFQNIALFRGMSALENILTGRNILMKRNLFLEMLFIWG
jgi:branched-chain amino acid transport system ATP-binding protein